MSKKMRVLLIICILLILLSIGSYVAFTQVNVTNIVTTPPPQEFENLGHNYEYTKGLLTSKPKDQAFTIKMDREEKIIRYDENTKFIVNHRVDVTKEQFELDTRNANDFFAEVKLFDEISASCPAVGECVAITVAINKK